MFDFIQPVYSHAIAMQVHFTYRSISRFHFLSLDSVAFNIQLFIKTALHHQTTPYKFPLDRAGGVFITHHYHYHTLTCPLTAANKTKINEAVSIKFFEFICHFCQELLRYPIHARFEMRKWSPNMIVECFTFDVIVVFVERFPNFSCLHLSEFRICNEPVLVYVPQFN